jgi:putative FmdB family regulatory protein
VPTYVYRCSDCDHYFEVMQSMSDDPVTVCEACSGEVTRVLFAPAIHFKGSGFHNTDYGTKRRPVGGDGAGDGAGTKTADGAGGNGASTGNGATGNSGTSSSESAGSSSSKTVGLDKA